MHRLRIEAFLACALLTCPATAVFAEPPPGAGDQLTLSGRGEMAAGVVLLDGGQGVIQGGETDEYWTLGGAAALDAAWGSPHVQLDFRGGANVDERSANDTYLQSYGGGIHLNLRDPELGSIGPFGGVGEFKINHFPGSDPQTLSWTAGLEGQLYIDRVTLYLQGGYVDRESLRSGGDIGALSNAGFGRVMGRYFPWDQVELSAGVSYTQGLMDPDRDDVRIIGWEAGAEWRPHGWPLSGFVSYTGAHYDQNDDDDIIDQHCVRFGIRLTLGQESLLANDRHGASLELPRWLELSATTAGPLE